MDTGGSIISDRPAEPAVAAFGDAVDALLASSLTPASGEDAAAVVAALEREQRRLYAAAIEVMDGIDRAGLYRTDGHPNVKVQVRHVAKLSNGEALARSRTMAMLRALPLIKAALWAGEIGIEQVQVLAKVFANPRVRDAMEDRQERFIDQAQSMDHRRFETRVRAWERLVDQDGPEPANERTHRNRAASMSQSPVDLDWQLVATFAAMQGMQIFEIWDRYIDAEWQADWDKTVAEHGDAASVALMPRSDAQRRADALWQVFQDAAANPAGAVPPGFTHNIVWSADTYQEMLRRMAGEDPQPLDPDRHLCETIDGIPLEPHEAAANSLLSAFRRVVIAADGVALDMGHKRFFTGALRDAIAIQRPGQCVWPGCQVPATACEADHLHDHHSGGRTNAPNGAPLCGFHNRWKQHGYTIQRNPDGTWTTHRPNGTPIDP